MYAMVHLAMHDALNAIVRRFRPYILGLRGPKTASPEAALAAAAHDVLVSVIGHVPTNFPNCVQTALAGVEADYTAALATVPDGAAKTDGIAVGQTAAARVIARRSTDGSDVQYLDSSYPQGSQPGEYRNTLPYTFVLAPGWANVTPFTLRDASQYLPGPPFRVGGNLYAADFNEVKALGGDGTTTPSNRTADQTEIARFWVESAALQWNRIARTVSDSAGFDLWMSARLYSLVNMALVDALIGSWKAKYLYNFWRPITAIHSADIDGNPNTAVDTTWTALVFTPPFPEYDSVHAVQGGAAADVLRRVFGTDSMSFQTCSTTLLPGSTCNDPAPKLRQFTSFIQAANESGLAQILVGANLRKSVNEGLRHGRKIGTHVVAHSLEPVA
jgi:hypothetical protein